MPEVDQLRMEAYQALLDGPIRNAYLHALYRWNPRPSSFWSGSTSGPATSALPVQAALLRQLQRAAEARSSGRIRAPRSSIQQRSTPRRGEARRIARDPAPIQRQQVVLVREKPTFFDASVFAYTGLLLGGSRHSLWPEAHAQPAAFRQSIEDAHAVGLMAHQSRLWAILEAQA